jgi:hypothetical protein
MTPGGAVISQLEIDNRRIEKNAIVKSAQRADNELAILTTAAPASKRQDSTLKAISASSSTMSTDFPLRGNPCCSEGMRAALSGAIDSMKRAFRMQSVVKR